MEVKYELLKPYTDEQRINFIIEYNHNQGYVIQETETALQALGYTQEELEQQEAERIAKLNLTGSDVERGIYKAKGMDFNDILAYVTQLQPEGLDVKALGIELKANHFYRGNPYVDAVGALLGFTKEQLDRFFEFNDYRYLTYHTVTINIVPENATVVINGIERNSISFPYGESQGVNYSVSAEGYITQECSILATESQIIDVELVAIPQPDTTVEEPVEEIEDV